jgi:hypothetical protein
MTYFDLKNYFRSSGKGIGSLAAYAGFPFALTSALKSCGFAANDAGSDQYRYRDPSKAWIKQKRLPSGGR